MPGGHDPRYAQKLQKLGFDLLLETGAGAKADFADRLYESLGCGIVDGRQTLFEQADIILKVRPLPRQRWRSYRRGKP
ncbi:hypothetical protein NON20_11810 [Synechocystis sp. B12]|nr:hypothetical protein NON20_11810 [Synechocystis sp. B12]